MSRGLGDVYKRQLYYRQGRYEDALFNCHIALSVNAYDGYSN